MTHKYLDVSFSEDIPPRISEAIGLADLESPKPGNTQHGPTLHIHQATLRAKQITGTFCLITNSTKLIAIIRFSDNETEGS